MANVIGRVECVDASRSSITPRRSGGRGKLKSFYVDPQAAKALPLFRLHEKPTLIMISEALKTRLDGAGLSDARIPACDEHPLSTDVEITHLVPPARWGEREYTQRQDA